MKAQRWIQKNILAVPKPHGASAAYSDGDTVFKAAMRHRAARWLIKIDIQSFFESIKEPYVYSVFEKLGYPDLLSFELARICTRLPTIGSRRAIFERRKAIPNGVLKNRWMGFLPQGAPTSPQLANLVMRKFDRRVTKAATDAGLRYSRYSDDLIFSTTGTYTRGQAEQFLHAMYDQLGAHGFEANRAKTTVAGPGGRKVVLGLLVDRDRPRLTRDFRANIETHVHYIERGDVGPILHARFRGFDSVIGFQNHLIGLIAFAGQVDPGYGNSLLARVRAVNWPI
jgi:RNA-directed DNA polymerase